MNKKNIYIQHDKLKRNVGLGTLFKNGKYIFLRLYRQQNPPQTNRLIGLFALTYAGHFWQNLQFNKESLVLSFRLGSSFLC